MQELAKQLGVDAEGTKKEIATRCAAVEVDIPDESELTEEDKRAAEEAAAEAAGKCIELRFSIRAILRRSLIRQKLKEIGVMLGELIEEVKTRK